MSNGLIASFKAASTIPAYRIVALSAADTVTYGVTVTTFPIGVTTDTVQDTNGCAIPVQLNGIAKVYFNDSCAAGALVASNTLGMGVPFAALSASASYAIGILLGTKVNATGTVADVLIAQICDRASA